MKNNFLRFLFYCLGLYFYYTQNIFRTSTMPPERRHTTITLKLISKMLVLWFAIEIPVFPLFLAPNAILIHPNFEKFTPGALSPSSDGVRICFLMFFNSEKYTPSVRNVFKVIPRLQHGEQTPIHKTVILLPKSWDIPARVLRPDT